VELKNVECIGTTKRHIIISNDNKVDKQWRWRVKAKRGSKGGENTSVLNYLNLIEQGRDKYRKTIIGNIKIQFLYTSSKIKQVLWVVIGESLHAQNYNDQKYVAIN